MTENNDADVRAMEADRAGEKKGGGGGSIIAIIIILIIIAGLAYFFLGKKGPGGGQKGPELGALQEILPEKCAMFMQVDMSQLEDKTLKEKMWTKLKESEGFKEQVEKLQKDSGINLEEDILSWVGDQITISFFTTPEPPDAPTTKRDTSKDSFVVVVEVKKGSEKKAEDKIKELMTKEGDKYTQEKYSEVNIWVPKDPESPDIAFLKGYLVLGNSTDDIKKCVDTSNKKGPSIKDNKDFQKAMKYLPPKPVGSFYMNMQEAIAASKDKLPPQANPEAEKIQKALMGMGVGIAQKNGDWIGSGYMGVDKASDSAFIQGLLASKPGMGVPESVKLFPKDTAFYGAFDAKVIYNIFMKVAEKSGGTAQIEQGKEQMKQQMGVDLDKDIIENLSGEMAYALDFQEFIASMMGGAGNRQGGANQALAAPLNNITSALEMYAAENEGKYPESLLKLAPKQISRLPKAPQGLSFYYKKTDDPEHYLLGYSQDGSQLNQQLPYYDSDTGMQGVSTGMGGGEKPVYPIVGAMRIKNADAFKGAFEKIMAKVPPTALQKSEYGGVDLYKAGGGQGAFGVFQDFFLFGMGLGVKKMDVIIDNKMDESKSLASDPVFQKIKGQIKPSTLSVTMIKFEKLMPMLKMASGFAVAQNPEAAQHIDSFFLEMDKYDSFWSFSEMADDGVKFDFIMAKKAEK